jgi:hypothetical protein
MHRLHPPTNPPHPPGERTNLSGGRACAATADLFLLLRVPSAAAWLAAYTAVPLPRPLLLAATLSEPPVSLDALAAAERRVTARWLLERLPRGQQLPPRVLARVPDDGRGEFTLSRARHNWRRLMAARAWAAGSVGAAYVHVCEWNNAWHSGGVAATVVLGGFFPSQVVAALLVVAAALLWRSRGERGADEGPPRMEADIALPDEDGGDGGSAVPADPYTALKQNYEAVVQFTTTVSGLFEGGGGLGWVGWGFCSGRRGQGCCAWPPRLALLVLAHCLPASTPTPATGPKRAGWVGFVGGADPVPGDLAGPHRQHRAPRADPGVCGRAVRPGHPAAGDPGPAVDVQAAGFAGPLPAAAGQLCPAAADALRHDAVMAAGRLAVVLYIISQQ